MNILRLNDVTKKVGLGKTSLYTLIKDNDFPLQVRLSAKASGWLEHEIDEWIATRARSRTDKLQTQ
jgi:prophage regulatory protein